MTPIAGLEAADAVLVDALARQASLQNTLASAERQRADATTKRDALVSKTAAGKVVTAKELAEVEQALRTAETQASIVSAALPAVDGLVAEAQQRVGQVLVAEARRLEAAAQEVYAAATQAADAATQRKRAAGEALQQATHFIASATNRRAWGDRIPRIACEKSDYADEMSATGWAAFLAANTQKQTAAVDSVARRNAIADRIMAEASGKAT